LNHYLNTLVIALKQRDYGQFKDTEEKLFAQFLLRECASQFGKNTPLNSSIPYSNSMNYSKLLTLALDSGFKRPQVEQACYILSKTGKGMINFNDLLDQLETNEKLQNEVNQVKELKQLVKSLQKKNARLQQQQQVQAISSDLKCPI